MSDRAWQHPWLRIQRLIRSILAVRQDPVTRPVLKLMLRDAIKEREKIRHADWSS